MTLLDKGPTFSPCSKINISQFKAQFKSEIFSRQTISTELGVSTYTRNQRTVHDHNCLRLVRTMMGQGYNKRGGGIITDKKLIRVDTANFMMVSTQMMISSRNGLVC